MAAKRSPKREDTPPLSFCGGAVEPYAVQRRKKHPRPDEDAGSESNTDEVLQGFPSTPPLAQRRNRHR